MICRLRLVQWRQLKWTDSEPYHQCMMNQCRRTTSRRAIRSSIQVCNVQTRLEMEATRPRVESPNDINKKHRELRHGAERDSIEQHNCGLLVWTLGVCTGDGPRALTWKVPCAPVVAADTDCWSAIVDGVCRFLRRGGCTTNARETRWPLPST